MTYIKESILDDEKERKALVERFRISQKVAQVDPWKARADGQASDEFTQLKIAG